MADHDVIDTQVESTGNSISYIFKTTTLDRLSLSSGDQCSSELSSFGDTHGPLETLLVQSGLDLDVSHTPTLLNSLVRFFGCHTMSYCQIVSNDS